LFMSGVVQQSAARKGASIAAVVMMIVLLMQTLVISAAPYLPPSVASMLTPRMVLAVLDQTRRGFDQTAATTMIQPGARLKTIAEAPMPVLVAPKVIAAKAVAPMPIAPESEAPKPVEAKPVVAATVLPVPAPAPPPVQTPAPEPEVLPAPAPVATAMQPHPPAVTTPAPPPVVVKRLPPAPPKFTAADAAKVRAVLDRQDASWQRDDPDLAGHTTLDGVQIAGDGDSANVDGRVRIARGSMLETHAFSLALHRHSGEWTVVRSSMSGVVERTQLAPAERTQPALLAAPSRIERFLTGSAVLVLPRVIGERLGLFHIGGGRGFLWFADVDTFAFDVILLFALLVLASRSRTTWRNPLTWLVLAITLLIFGPLAYSISNFGTLFRLREMIYLGLLLIPLAAATRRDEQQQPTN